MATSRTRTRVPATRVVLKSSDMRDDLKVMSVTGKVFIGFVIAVAVVLSGSAIIWGVSTLVAHDKDLAVVHKDSEQFVTKENLSNLETNVNNIKKDVETLARDQGELKTSVSRQLELQQETKSTQDRMQYILEELLKRGDKDSTQ